MDPRTDWQEATSPEDKARYEDYGRRLAAMQKQRDLGGPVRRALHLKAHVGARARFRTLPDLPPEYRVGIFGAAGEYDAWVRFSNGAQKTQGDHTGDVRGLAIKLLGVPGTKLIPGLEGARTQDFLLIHLKTFGFRNSEEFMNFVDAARTPALLLPRLFARFGLRTFSLLRALSKATGRKIGSMATERFYGPAPIMWGKHAAKLSAIPLSPPVAPVRGPSPDYLKEDLIARLTSGPIEYELAVQLYRDPKTTPIEDASVDWNEQHAPFVSVGRLTIPSQDLTGEAGSRQMEYVERLSFDPWHAPVEFRPLGDIMRARGEAYRVSTIARKAEAEPEMMRSF